MERQTLFTAYADDLDAYLAANSLGVFYANDHQKRARALYCPLCLRLHPSIHATDERPELTIEHNPPESVGGSPVLLTCRTCNSTGGSSTDHLIQRSLKERPFVQRQPDSILPARVRIGRSTAPAYLKRGEGGTFRISLAHTAHEYVQNVVNNHFKARGGQMGLSVSLVKTESLNRALFKVAHLEAFRYFGHSYLLHPNAKAIVADLGKNEPAILNYGRLSGVPSDAADGMYGALVDRQMICFAVIFRIKHLEQWEKVAYALPGYGSDGFAEYMRYNSFGSGKKILLKSLEGSCLPFGNVGCKRYEEAWGEVTRTLWDFGGA